MAETKKGRPSNKFVNANALRDLAKRMRDMADQVETAAKDLKAAAGEQGIGSAEFTAADDGVGAADALCKETAYKISKRDFKTVIVEAKGSLPTKAKK